MGGREPLSSVVFYCIISIKLLGPITENNEKILRKVKVPNKNSI